MRKDKEARDSASRNKVRADSGYFTQVELEEFMKNSGVQFPSEFSSLPYWDEIRDYLIDLVHLVKNLGEHIGEKEIR
ncbi:hypothetical protein CYMTET_6252 [Cymbomonas tetramitiformis]|uniref:Uncharacterized protein n=1 Tax=Cymbomonas tetramitiformis TaxID=36881 RepID=A0AAE0GXV3_9CHLO|nr:hypothetical protein CYMTET_6252 [Cymbomonas tetramitiformis]